MENILKILPNKFPFILVDKIIKYKNNNFICTLKNVSFNEQYFQGHFTNNEFIMPGSLIIENMAQTSGLLIYKKYNLNYLYNICYLVSINKIKFNFSVYPGDQIITKAIYINRKINFVKIKVTSLVNKIILCFSEMIFFIKNKK